MAIYESGEMYLETIHVLSQKNGAVRSVDISEHMNYSKPSVSRAVGLLKKDGYISVDKDGFITLTDSGLEVAQKIYERHTVLSRLLMMLGVDADTAVPMEFWRLLALYISSNMLSSIPWAIPFGEGEITTMLNQARDVLAWYDNMKNPVPTWYDPTLARR